MSETDPRNSDTDQDGLSDWDEINIHSNAASCTRIALLGGISVKLMEHIQYHCP